MEIPVYKTIGRQFWLGKKGFKGYVVGSPWYLYFVMISEMQQGVMAAGAMGGLVGGLIVAGVSAIAESVNGKPIFPATCVVGQLPPETLGHPEWPCKKRRHMNRNVLMIPQAEVELITHPGFTNQLTLTHFTLPIKMNYSMFKGAKVKDYLRATNWRLKWKGQLLQPGGTEARL